MASPNEKYVPADKIFMVLKDSISKVYENEYFLIENGVGEWSIAAQLFYYLKKNCKNRKCDFNVDCEYNKMFTENVYSGTSLLKRIDERDKNGNLVNVRPDIIVHKRGSNGIRLAWIEIKRKEGDDNSWDLKK